MPGHTPRLNLPFPNLDNSESPTGPAEIQALAAALDGVVIYGQGALSNRGGAGIQGRFYMVVGDSNLANNGILWYDNGTSWQAVASAGLAVSSQSGTSYMFGIGDEDSLVLFTSASPVVASIPAHTDAPFSVGHFLSVIQMGAGQLTIAGVSGVSVHGNPGTKTFGQYAGATAFCVGTDSWVVMGNTVS